MNRVLPDYDVEKNYSFFSYNIYNPMYQEEC